MASVVFSASHDPETVLPGSARTRRFISGRNSSLRRRNTVVKAESSNLPDNEDDSEDADGPDDVDLEAEQSKEIYSVEDAVNASGTDIRRHGASSGPIRTIKSRMRGESSQKRKEQNRLAQRAFRQRQKAYFVDLEAEVVEKSSQIQVITKNNQSLMEMMERLQRENIALKAAKAPGVTGISPLNDLALENVNNFTASDQSGVKAPDGLRVPSGSRQHDSGAGEEVLVSINDLASVSNEAQKKSKNQNKAKKKTQIKSATTRRRSTETGPITTAIAPLSSRLPSKVTPHSRSTTTAHHEQMGKSGTAYSSGYQRRQSSSASHGSVSQTSVLAGADSPNATSSSGITSPVSAQSRPVKQLTETINNSSWVNCEWETQSPTRSSSLPTGSTMTDSSVPADVVTFALSLNGTIASSHQLHRQSLDQAMFSDGSHQAGLPHSPFTAGLYDQHQHDPRQQHQNQHRPIDPARKYSEALLRYHAEAPISSSAHGRRATVGDPSSMTYPQSPVEFDRMKHCRAGHSLDDTQAFARPEQIGWMNTWRWLGTSYMNAFGMPLEQNMNEMYTQQAPASLQQPVPSPTPVMFMQPPQAGNTNPLERSQQPPNQAEYQAKLFAGAAQGLKSDAHGGIMPFTQNLTPIDGVGPLDNPFRPDFDPDQSGQVWRDQGDLQGGDSQMYGVDGNSPSGLFDTPSEAPFVGL